MKWIAGLVALALMGCSTQEDAADTAASDAAAATPLPAASEDPAAFLVSLTQRRQAGEFAPRDECGELPGALEFREKIVAAVLARDEEAMLALADQDIRLDFGGGSGREQLREQLASPGWQLWTALENVLPLGCAANGPDSFTIPWYFAQEIPGDPYMTLIVRGEDVPLFSDPNPEAVILERLSWSAVELMDDSDRDNENYAKVITPEGRLGYIPWDDLRSLIDYRLIANRHEDGWAITAFVAGD